MPNPITPPPELVQQWRRTAPHPSNEHEHYHYITLCAAQWGADMELEACCEWMAKYRRPTLAADLKFVRRPKAPSLKKQALKILSQDEWSTEEEGIIRRALEALPDD